MLFGLPFYPLKTFEHYNSTRRSAANEHAPGRYEDANPPDPPPEPVKPPKKKAPRVSEKIEDRKSKVST